MRRTLTALAALFLADALLMAGSGVFGTLLSLQMGLRGLPSGVTGLVMACFYLGLCLGFFVAYRILAMVGHIRAFAVFAAVHTALVMLHALFWDPWLWAGLRLLSGICMMGIYMVLESWLNERAEKKLRGSVFAVYMVVSMGALGGSQFLLNIGDPSGHEHFFLIGLLFVLSLVPIAMSRATHPQPLAPVEFDLRHLFRRAPYGPVACAGAGMLAGAFYALGAAYGVKVGLPTSEIAGLMGVTVLSGLVLQWPMGFLSDRVDRRKVIASLGLGVVLACLALVAVSTWQPTLLLYAAAVFGGITFTVYPMGVAHANDYVEGSELVAASGSLLLMYALGATLGPILASALMMLAGPEGLWIYGTLVGAAILLAYPVTRPPVAMSGEAQEHFVGVPRTSPIIANLDPRSE